MATPKATVGAALTITVAVAPSIVKALIGDPPSLTDKWISPSIVIFLIVTSLPDTIIFKSLSTPTDNPVSFNIPSVPEVVSLASDRKNCAESRLSNN